MNAISTGTDVASKTSYWLNRTIDDFLAEAIAKSPEKVALVAYRADRGADPALRMTYAELGTRVARVAGSLRSLGVGHGDVVAVQLPNWWEFVIISLAVGRIGAVVNPLMPIFRERELSFMLGLAEAKVLVVPKMFRGFDHAAMASSLQASIPTLRHVFVVDGEDDNSFEKSLMIGNGEDAIYDPTTGLSPDELALVMFTSGTTGQPKGAMHNCNTLICLTTAFAERAHLNSDEIIFGCSPIGHMTGFAAAMLESIRLGATLVLLDVWEAGRAVAIMDKERISYVMAASSFLEDICNGVAAGAPRPSALSLFLCGGAPIPPALIERAERELGIPVSSLWGMTESLLGTVTEPERAGEKSAKTDGRPVTGMEVCVVDSDRRPMSTGETGALLVRGPQMFMGYFKRPDIATVDADGWFDTGDLAYMDDEGYIRINGRSKDVLIRGGENVPVFEIESLIYRHPAVAEVAIVGYPDSRLGERGCAFVTLKPGASLTLSEVQQWMADSKTAKQYWPEQLDVVKELPKTLTGKVQKFLLRERAKKFENL